MVTESSALGCRKRTKGGIGILMLITYTRVVQAERGGGGGGSGSSCHVLMKSCVRM
jgi:hypothetical protein